MSEARSSKILIFSLISVTVLFVFAAVKRSVPAVASYSRIVRVIETAPFDVPHPAGLTYVKDGDFFAYLPAATAGNLAAESALMQVDFSDVPQGKVDLPLALSNPLNIAYNPLAKKLLVFDDLNNEMIECGLDDRNLPVPASLQRLAVNHFGLVGANGMTTDPTSGDLFVLDGDGRHFIKIEVSTDQAAQGAAAYQSGLLSRTFVPQSPRGGFRGIAYNPTDGHLYALQPDSRRLFEFTVQGRIISVRDLSKIPMQNPQGMVFAPSGDRTDDPSTTSLYLADSGLPDTNRSGQIIEVTLAAPLAAEATFQSSLIQTIDTSLFYPPSPDPAGMAWHNLTEKILISDSEVNEMKIFTGDNLFAMTVDGSLYDSLSSVGYSEEPTGLAFNTANDHLFVADDNERRINEVDPGSDGLFDTADDQVTFFDTRLFDSYDPEGVAFDAASQTLFIADGVNSEVYIVQRGGNGVFDGVPPEGDDQVSQFDTAGLGMTDPEGIEFNDINGHLYLAGNGDKDLLLEVTAGGAFVQGIDISAANARAPSGLACGPGSFDPETLSIFLSDRGVDNGADPNENDGKIYEMTLPVSEPDDVAPLVTIFDLPDTWTSLTVPVLSFAATDNIGVTGYLATESESPPAAGDVGWSPTPPDSYTFAADGTKTLYGWARDAAGNVSTGVSDTVVITLLDTEAPQVTAFELPETADTLTVAISGFSATDDTGVTGYLATESGSTPAVDDPGWSATPPDSYTFTAEGTKTLYGWAKDAAGNVSTGLSDTVVITLPDSEAPQVTAFELPETATSLTVAINSFTATDDTGVTGYLATESGSTPAVDDPGWSGTPPTQYTFAAAGSQTLYGWARDAAGNISTGLSDTVVITLLDTEAPQVTAFDLPETATTLTVAISSFSATDDTGVTGYLATESGSTPAVDDAGWSATPPTQYTFASDGTKTLYGWARDAAGNVSTGVSDTVVITLLDTEAPQVTAFDLPETATTLTVAISSFTATDDTGVTGYLATESGSTPAVDDPGWSATPPTDYTFANGGSQTLYGWAKDAAGNVSTGVSDTVVISLGPMHVGDLDGSVRLRGKSPNWDAYATVTVHDQNHSGVPGVTVSAIWSGDANLTGSGVTDGSGVVTLDTGNISGGSSVTFTVTNLALDGYTYDPVSNHDPDGDSDGTSITVNRPQ
jgi:uncharacterized protein YjiK